MQSLFAAAPIVAALAAIAPDDARSVDRIEVVDYGIYAVARKAQGQGANGIGLAVVSKMRHQSTTRTVPAKIGVTFGFHYKVVGQEEGETVELRKVTRFPPPGMVTAGGKVLHRTERRLRNKIGETRFTSYTLTDAFELVPGTWTIELWQGAIKLASESFTLEKL